MASTATTPAASLVTLPTELVLMILKVLHSKRCLRAAITAFEKLRSVYRSYSEEIYTAITIRQLTRRGFDPFRPSNMLSIQLRDSRFDVTDICDAVHILYEACQQHVLTEGKGSIRCAVNVCTVALHIRKAVEWDLPKSWVEYFIFMRYGCKNWDEGYELIEIGEWYKKGFVLGECTNGLVPKKRLASERKA